MLSVEFIVLPRVLGVFVVLAEKVRLLVGVEVAQVDLLQGQAAVRRVVREAKQDDQILPAALGVYLQEATTFHSLLFLQHLELFSTETRQIRIRKAI